MLKFVRFLRLSRLINYINTSSDVKYSLKLIQSVFLAIMYIHLTACGWFFLTKQNKDWEPSQGLKENFFEIDEIAYRWIISIYASMLAITGNDVFPANLLEYFFAGTWLLIGAVLQASIFGQFTSIVQTISRK